MAVSTGEIVEGIVSDILNYGVFIKLKNGKSGLVHISEISNDYVEDIHKVLKSGDKVKAKVLSVDKNGKIALSLKKVDTPKKDNEENKSKSKGPLSLDDMLSQFLKDSDERQLDLKRSFEAKRGTSRKRA